MARNRFSEWELAELERNAEAISAQYGSNYPGRYGWAASAVKTAEPDFKGRIGLRDLARIVGLDHVWPYYELANLFVHATSRGVQYSIGVPDSCGGHVAGPTNTGFTDPAHNAAISLVQATGSLLSLDWSLARLAAFSALNLLQREVGEAFLDVQKEIEIEEDGRVESAEGR